MTAFLATITIDVDPVLHVGGLAIHWYGVMYVVAFIAGYRFGVRPYLERRGISAEESERMCAWVIGAGLVGARLYYVIQSSPPQGGSWRAHPAEILAVWHGGMAFFGAIIGGLATVAWLCHRRRLSFWPVADAAVLFGVIGQPIGRIGNIINGDILGPASSLPWATVYANPNAVLQPGFDHLHAYQPAAAYEALGTILIGLVLYGLLRRGVRDGVLAITYLGLYAVSQLVLFELRDSEPVVALHLKQAQWTSIVVLVVALPLLVAAWRRDLLDFRDPPADGRDRRPGTAGAHPVDAVDAAPAERLGREPAKTR